MTNKQDQINTLDQLIHEKVHIHDHVRRMLAEHLVDSGVGTKDRFRLGFGYGGKMGGPDMVIEPEDYSKEKTL